MDLCDRRRWPDDRDRARDDDGAHGCPPAG